MRAIHTHTHTHRCEHVSLHALPMHEPCHVLPPVIVPWCMRLCVCVCVHAASFARQRLVLSGRCHESEVFKEFRMSTPRYRRVGAISDEVLRDMVRNLSDTIDRSPKGFLRGVSLKPRVDAFTGQTVGGSGQSQARVAVTGGVLDPRDLLGDTGAAGGAQVQQQAQEAASTQQQQGTSAGSAPQTSEVAKVET